MWIAIYIYTELNPDLVLKKWSRVNEAMAVERNLNSGGQAYEP